MEEVESSSQPSAEKKEKKKSSKSSDHCNCTISNLSHEDIGDYINPELMHQDSLPLTQLQYQQTQIQGIDGTAAHMISTGLLLDIGEKMEE